MRKGERLNFILWYHTHFVDGIHFLYYDSNEF